MRIRWPLIVGLALLVPGMVQAQTTPTEGLRDNSPAVHAFTDVRVVTGPGEVIENATLVIRNGVIEAVGANVTPPADARIWNLAGRTIYPGFIDAHASVGMREEPEEEERGTRYWNPQVRSYIDASAEVDADPSDASSLRSQGFTVAHAVPRLGIFRGQTAVVNLADATPNERVIRSGVAQSVQLSRDGELGFGYPTSAMGAMTFIRQTMLDSEWYHEANRVYAANPDGLRRPENNQALAALGPMIRGEQPALFDLNSDEEILRAMTFVEDFPISPWLKGSGYEYRLLEVIEDLDHPFILPLDFPETPDAQSPETTLNLSLADLRHWYLAPENPGRMAAAGMEFALTASDLEDVEDFLPNLRAAVARGLPAETAIAALTTVPARYLGIERSYGTLEVGKVANLVVTEGDLFDEDSSLRDVWIDGQRYIISEDSDVDPRGRWMVTSTAFGGELNLEGSAARPSGEFVSDGTSTTLSSARVTGESRRIQLAMPGSAIGQEGTVRLTGTISGDVIHGWGELPDGMRVDWRGERSSQVASGNGDDNGSPNSTRRNPSVPVRMLDLPEIRPSMEYGRESIPNQPDHVLIRNATLWTQGPDGIIEGGDLLVTRGEVAAVGQGLDAPSGAMVIDVEGKHVTPGLIDPHIHSGLQGGVNETGSAIVPEVRIGDVLTMNNIWMYRQLAGGLTTAHVMHGSANPIGGQNQHVKMRWGALPEDQKLAGAPRTVKFALGENPKRRSERYPDTRMGTDQIIRDHFQAAREYEQAWQEWEANGDGIPPRRDLRMDALVDILNGEILVQSHSYRQDEILMLMRIAEEFDMRIAAFHHGVEAYKVAPELAAHGAGAIVWSDWSSFKIEAYDATTFNVKVLLDAGVATSLHSDNSQIAARMNWEAGKMLRTGVSEEDALSLVTSSTARLLGVDDQVGSLEAGKDGDFVIWSDHPLSMSGVAEQTWIDGRKYYDIEEDRELRQDVERERAQLIQLILDSR